MINPRRLEELLEALGQLLEARGHTYTLITVGGGSLLLQRLSVRPTRDLDVIAVGNGGALRKAEVLPTPLLAAARDVGVAAGVGENWLNAGPAGLMDLGLPAGFDERAEVRLPCTSRPDLTRSVSSSMQRSIRHLVASTSTTCDSSNPRLENWS